MLVTQAQLELSWNPFNVTKVFKGNKIAQLVILPLPKIVMVEGKVIGVKTDRGDRGFGSSGK